jgi:hypothetical protein
VSFFEQNVLGLDVAVDHFVAMGRPEGVRHFPSDLQGVFDGKLLLTV